jgi:H+-translocating diphosphatase
MSNCQIFYVCFLFCLFLLLQALRLLMRINPRALIILSLLVFSGVLYVGASTSPIVVFVFCICTLSLFFSLYLTKWVLAKDEGPPEMSEV